MSKWHVIAILLILIGIVRLVTDRDWHSVGPWGSGIAIAAGAALVVADIRRRRTR